MARCPPPAWNGSWDDAPDNPSATSAVRAITRPARAASALGARGRTSCKRQVSGSIPLTGPSPWSVERMTLIRAILPLCLEVPRVTRATAERVIPDFCIRRVCPLTRRARRLKSTVETGWRRIGGVSQSGSGLVGPLRLPPARLIARHHGQLHVNRAAMFRGVRSSERLDLCGPHRGCHRLASLCWWQAIAPGR